MATTFAGGAILTYGFPSTLSNFIEQFYMLLHSEKCIVYYKEWKSSSLNYYLFTSRNYKFLEYNLRKPL